MAEDIPKHREASAIPYRGTSRRSIVLRNCVAASLSDSATVVSIKVYPVNAVPSADSTLRNTLYISWTGRTGTLRRFT